MSLLIGDVGGSSSRWALIAENGPVHFDGLPGYNPATGDADAFIHTLRGRWREVDHAIVYGAGCGSDERRQRMRAAMSQVFPIGKVPEIEVESDLLGAARGLCGWSPGLVLILGTGMNAGHYDGKALDRMMPSLGFILGDEGSGADIGKCLLRDALRGDLPAEVKEVVFPEGLQLEEVIERTYRSASPQAFLASFTAKLPQVRHAYVTTLLQERCSKLAQLIADAFPAKDRESISVTGSVAWAFQEVLRQALAARGMRLATVERDPMAGLVRFHRPPR